jgi:hypothetical protein
VTDEIKTVQAAPQFKGKFYGVELEIEASGLYEVESYYDEDHQEHIDSCPIIPEGWLREQEDSIAGVELISDRPYSFEETVVNIERVFKDIERQGFVPVRTPRGSTHVHANVADLTWNQMRSFVMACAWAEPTLIELAGKGRKGNLFAQSYETTPIGWEPVIQWCRREEFSQIVDTHYMGTSFHPMAYLGSVEFRMGPSARNAEDAIRWLMCIDTVVSAGRESEVGLDEPPFLAFLMSKFDLKKKNQLRKKGQRAALEIWHAMHEVYVKPTITTKTKKKSIAEFTQEYVASGLLAPSSFNTQQLINEIGSWTYPSLEAMEQGLIPNAPTAPTSGPAPAPSTPNNYGLCSDPNCQICAAVINNNNTINPTVNTISTSTEF